MTENEALKLSAVGLLAFASRLEDEGRDIITVAELKKQATSWLMLLEERENDQVEAD